jgi:hypothetical protein
VEVMMAITLLTIAIIPMIKMFDMGLHASTELGRYDQARGLANQQMEKVKALGYGQATATYSPPTPSCTITLPPGFTSCQMETYYVNQGDLQRPNPALTSGKTMEVVVTITWDGGANRYTTTGLKAQGSG